jgi:serine protease Do
VASSEVDDVVKIELLRDKRQMTLEVKIGPRPTQLKLARSAARKGAEEEVWRGVTVGPITDEIMEAFDIEDGEGIIVEDVRLDSPAYKAGLSKGDVIREINRVPIKDLDTFNKVIKGLKGNILVLTDKGYLVIKE